MKLYVTTYATALVAIATAQTPDTTFNQSMTIERDFAPVVEGAHKLDRLPAVEPISVTRIPAVYADWQAPVAAASQRGTLPAGQVIIDPNPNRLGYINASLGNYMNTDIAAGIGKGDFSLDAAMRFTKGDIRLLHDDYDPSNTKPEWSSKYLQGRIVAGYDHTFYNDARVRAHAGWEGVRYNLFDYFIDHQTNGEAATLSTGLPIWGRHVAAGEQSYARLLANAQLTAGRWDLRASFERTRIDYPGDVATAAPDYAESAVLVEAAFYGVRHKAYLVTFGLKAGATMGDGDGFTAKPEMHVSLLRGSHRMSRTWLDVAVGWERPLLHDVLARWPMARLSAESDGYDYKTPLSLYDATIGYENNEHGRFKWKIFAQSALTVDALGMYMLRSDWLDYADATTMAVRNYDNFNLRVGGQLSVEASRHVGVTLDVNYDVVESEKYVGTNNPKFDAQFHLLLHPTQRLDIDLSMLTALKREGYYKRESTERADLNEAITIDLGDVFDLGLQADYRLTDGLSVFLHGGNLLNRHIDRWGLVPDQGITVRGGFRWQF